MAAIASYLASSSSNSSPEQQSHQWHNNPTTSQVEALSLDYARPMPHFGGYDVVALQEVWVRSDGDAIARLAQEAGLKHSRWWHAYILTNWLSNMSLKSDLNVQRSAGQWTHDHLEVSHTSFPHL